jgi:hypothetical protein
MSAAAKANLVVSGVMGVLGAGATLLLGSGVWWLWGLVFFAASSTAVACAQIAALEDGDA